MGFGAFVEIMPKKEGLVRIGQLAEHHVDKVEEVVNIGDEIMVKVDRGRRSRPGQPLAARGDSRSLEAAAGSRGQRRRRARVDRERSRCRPTAGRSPIVGATGAAGGTLVRILGERAFPASALAALRERAQRRPHVQTHLGDVEVRELTR